MMKSYLSTLLIVICSLIFGSQKSESSTSCPPPEVASTILPILQKHGFKNLKSLTASVGGNLIGAQTWTIGFHFEAPTPSYPGTFIPYIGVIQFNEEWCGVESVSISTGAQLGIKILQ